MLTGIFTKEKNQIKSRSNLGDTRGNICIPFDFTYMHDSSKEERQSEIKQDIARINQLYVQQSLEDGDSLSLIVQYIWAKYISRKKSVKHQSLVFNTELQI